MYDFYDVMRVKLTFFPLISFVEGIQNDVQGHVMRDLYLKCYLKLIDVRATDPYYYKWKD